MTREQAKELMPIMQAFAEGKAIQVKIEGLTDWVDADEINLEYEGQKIKHRIKPEPNYRPFKNVEECWNEMQKHQPFGWLKIKNKNKFTILLDIRSDDDFEFKFNLCTFADGSPFGKKEE